MLKIKVFQLKKKKKKVFQKFWGVVTSCQFKLAVNCFLKKWQCFKPLDSSIHYWTVQVLTFVESAIGFCDKAIMIWWFLIYKYIYIYIFFLYVIKVDLGCDSIFGTQNVSIRIFDGALVDQLSLDLFIPSENYLVNICI